MLCYHTLAKSILYARYIFTIHTQLAYAGGPSRVRAAGHHGEDERRQPRAASIVVGRAEVHRLPAQHELLDVLGDSGRQEVYFSVIGQKHEQKAADKTINRDLSNLNSTLESPERPVKA